MSLSNYLILGVLSLSAVKVGGSLSIYPKSRYTLENITEAIILFIKKNNRYPLRSDKDASEYFGFPSTWQSVENSLLRDFGTTFSKLKKKIKEDKFRYKKLVSTHPRHATNYSLDNIEEAMIGFYRKNEELPKTNSGDASEYFGFSSNWSAVSAFLCRRDYATFKQLRKKVERRIKRMKRQGSFGKK